MISENITKLRRRAGLSQEETAEKVGVARQTIAKWEAGDSVPDIVNSGRLAELFNVSLDDLVNQSWDDRDPAGLPPKGKFIFGTVTVGEKGQIVIPAKARRVFGISPGSDLVILGDINQGLALMKADMFLEVFNHMQAKESEEQ